MTPTDADIEAVLAAEAKATPGPWTNNEFFVDAPGLRGALAAIESSPGQDTRDAEFIALARNHIRPFAEALRAERAALRASEARCEAMRAAMCSSVSRLKAVVDIDVLYASDKATLMSADYHRLCDARNDAIRKWVAALADAPSPPSRQAASGEEVDDGS